MKHSQIKDTRWINKHLDSALLIFIFTIVLSLSVTNVYAQELMLKTGIYHTELFLRMDPTDIVSVNKGERSVIVTFKKSIREPFNRNIQDNFILAIIGDKNVFTITFKDNVDYAAFNDDEGLKIVATYTKGIDDVLLSYDLHLPMLKSGVQHGENPRFESAFEKAVKLLESGAWEEAVFTLEKLLDGAPSQDEYYKQETLFKIAQIYMKNGDKEPSAYAKASYAMDRFMSNYPDSSRLLEAMRVSAEAKEAAGLFAEATKAYEVIYDLSMDAQTKRLALFRIGAIYREIGQFEAAIETYEKYLANYSVDRDKALVAIGNLYIYRNHKDNAYKIFSEMELSNILEIVDREQIMALARLFEERSDMHKAIRLYEHVIQEQGNLRGGSLNKSDSSEISEAMYKVAILSRAIGNNDKFGKMLEELLDYDISSNYAHLALIEKGRLHLKTSSYEELVSLLAPLITGTDPYGLRLEAHLILVESLDQLSQINELIAMIDQVLREYPTSNYTDELLQLKEDRLLLLAVMSYEDGSLDRSIEVYKQMLEEFPASKRFGKNVTSIDDIVYLKAQMDYDAGLYAESIVAVNARFADDPKPTQRWYDLWEDAMYKYIDTNKKTIEPSIVRLKSREYLSQMPRGKYVPQVKTILQEKFIYPYEGAYTAENYAEVVRLYSENEPWLNMWHDQEFANKAKILAVSSLIKLQMNDKAVELFNTTTPMMDKTYAMVGYSLCQDIFYDINMLTIVEFDDAVNSMGECSEEYISRVIKSYSRDAKSSLKAQYLSTKSISDDESRWEMLSGIYTQLLNKPSLRFVGYEDVYFTVGTTLYNEGKYSEVVDPLEKFVSLADNNDEKKSEALYYMGKSKLAIGDRLKGFEYLNRIINQMPDSMFKTMAENEIEEDSWKRGLKKR